MLAQPPKFTFLFAGDGDRGRPPVTGPVDAGAHGIEDVPPAVPVLADAYVENGPVFLLEAEHQVEGEVAVNQVGGDGPQFPVADATLVGEGGSIGAQVSRQSGGAREAEQRGSLGGARTRRGGAGTRPGHGS